MDTSGSLIDLMRGVIPADAGIMQGDVISESPLKIQVKGDDKLLLTESSLIVPWHLQDYETSITIRAYDFALDEAYVKMHNHLRKGDVVHLLSLQAGKLYYILDRVWNPPED